MRRSTFSLLVMVLAWAGSVLAGGSAAIAQDKSKKAAAFGGKKVALVVGVQEYEVERLKLANARKDATEIARGLREIGFSVHLVTDPTREQLGTTLAAFEADLSQADIGLFFYSGHGMQTVRAGSVEASNLLLPRDFRLPDGVGREREQMMDESTVALEDVIKKLRQNARVGIVFLDACRDNPFAAEEIRTAQEAAGPVATRRASVSRGLSRTDAPAVGPAPAQPAITKISRNITTGMVIAYATAPGEVADDGAGEHSPFTRALLKHIKKPQRTIEQMLRDVATDVHAATDGAQRPWVSASLLGGDLYLVPPMNGAVLPPVRSMPSLNAVPSRPALTPPRAASLPRALPPASRAGQAARSAPARAAAPARSAPPRTARASGGGGGGSRLPPSLGMGVGAGL